MQRAHRSRRAALVLWVTLAGLLALSGCVTGGGGTGDADQGGALDQGPGGLRLDGAHVPDAARDAAVPIDACLSDEPERCNGLDDDCDGQIDEDFAGLGDACSAGEGICAAAGRIVCTADEAATRCDAQAGAPAEREDCNGLDDDCDGAVDEGFSVGIFCQISEGECTSRGVEICTADGRGTECGAEPIRIEDEKCDGFDNDCDGLIDEGIDLGALCEAGVGLCRRGGFVECNAAGEVYCTARPGNPREEICNGFDDDCDGIADEDFGAEPCEAGVGVCRRVGQTVCQGEGELVCNVVAGEPTPELCNGLDDDCDGRVDEDFGGADGSPCQNGEGVCARFGVFACSADGRRVTCSADPAGPPAGAEICNGLDDDCDGRVDEEIVGVGQVCDGVDLALCQVGLTACNDAGEIVCQAVDLEPGQEFCNGIDDDCDGAVDEDYPLLGDPCAVGEGICAAQGIYRCEDRAGGLGGGFSFEGIRQGLPEAELLRGGFQECWRGRYNEGQPPVAQILAACGEDILMLGCRPAGDANLTLAAMGERAAILQDSGQVQNPVNVHNGVNWYFSDRHSWGFGPVGEPLSRNSCDTANTLPELRMCWHTGGGNMNSGYRCGATFLNGNNAWERIIYQRPAGPEMVCSAVPGAPEEERCNGLDDDCDGATDEGAAGTGEVCQEGVGLCERGETVCDPQGELICRAIPIEPSDEQCNGIDDDCNGVVDDVPGIGQECTVGDGICARPGVLACPPPGEARVQLQPGVLRDVDPAALEAQGFRRCFAGSMNGNEPLDPVLAACEGEVMLLGCRDVGAPNLRVAAMGLREEILTDVGNANGALHPHNGVGWYFSRTWSWGFVPDGEPVNRNSCDVQSPAAEDRMCWHTGAGNLNPGYRCGASTNAGQLERVIYVADRLGSQLECRGEAGAPQAERCNGLDDDCDGTVDEGFGLNTPCQVGLGECRVAGVTVCDAAGEPVCDARPGAPAEEICNRRDDDCDGQVDEGLDCPRLQRPVLMRCGGSGRDVQTFIDPGDDLRLVADCAPNDDTQALLVTRQGVANVAPNAAAWRAYVEGGGVIITEFSASDDVYNAIFGANVVEGAFTGGCQDNINPPTRFSLDDPFWVALADLPLPAANVTGCGRDMQGWNAPYVRLGGWNANTTSLAYRDLGAGRVWLVETDWQDREAGFGAESRQLMRYMLFNGLLPGP